MYITQAEYVNKCGVAKRLIERCCKEADKNEYRTSTIRGVSNLSRSDLEAIVYYCKTFINQGTLGGLMTPRGGVGEVLKKAKLI